MRLLRGHNSFEADSPWLRVRTCARYSFGPTTIPTSTEILVAAFAVLLVFVIAGGASCEVTSAAQCEIQTIAPANAPAATPEQERFVNRLAVDNKVASYYRRGPDGDWIVPRVVNRNDPRVMLLLMTPNEPLLLEVSIFVDDKPYRHRRETWIDDAIKLAGKDKKENAASPPTPPNSLLKKGATAGLPSSECRKRPKNTAGQASSGTQNSRIQLFQRSAKTSTTDQIEVSKADVATADAEEKEPGENWRMHRRAAPRKRLMQYAVAVGGELERDEARWLLAQWTPGPTLLILRPEFAAGRAGDAPVLHALDKDKDEQLSAEEVADAHKTLLRCDTDGDEMLEASELVRAAAVSWGDNTAWHPSSLLMVLDESTDWREVRGELKKNYGKIPAHLETATMSRKPNGLSPDVAVRVSFGKREKHVAGLSVEHVGKRITSARPASRQTSRAVILENDAIRLEISAAQERMAGDTTARESDQVAIGAIVDGGPLLGLLDSDADLRLSRRETRAVGDCLARLDRDQDGAISKKEIPTPIRLVVTKGPYAHRVLCAPRLVVLETAAKSRKTPPPWFLGMDKNKDGDVTRDEFLGTDEQFNKLDTNADDMISGEEALKLQEDAQ